MNLFKIPLIYIYIYIGLNLDTFDAQNPSCTAETSQKGKFNCRYAFSTEISNFECTITGSHTCVASITSTERSQANVVTAIVFNVVVKMASYTDQNIHITLYRSIGSTKVQTGNVIQIKYPFDANEKPRFECPQLKSYDDGYASKSTCKVYLSAMSQTIKKSDGSTCDIEIQGNTATKEGILFYKTITYVVKDTEKKCKRTCRASVEISGFTIDGNKVSHEFTHTSKCQETFISLIGHDSVERKATFSFEIPYEFNAISIESSPSGKITLDPQSISSDTYKAQPNFQKVVTYTINNFEGIGDKIDIILKVLQDVNHEAYAVTAKLSHKLKPEEQSHITCEPKAIVHQRMNEETVYSCSLVAQSTSVTLTTDSTTHLLVNNVVTLTKQTNGLHTNTNHELTIKAKKVSCNEHHMVKIKFPNGGSGPSIENIVSHTTMCKEPEIDCDTHNSVDRTISCKLKLEFTFNKIRIASSASHVIFEPIEIDNRQFLLSVDVQKVIKYTVTDFKTENHNFNLIFKIIQTGSRMPKYTKQFGFKYVLKSEEMPNIICNPNDRKVTSNPQSSRYKCSGLALNWNETLHSTTRGFVVKPSWITGRNINQVYRYESFDLFVTPNEVKCDEKIDVQVTFMEPPNTRTLTLKHITKCPEPIIKCPFHDLVGLSITCNFEISFVFSKIEITHSENQVTITDGDIESSLVSNKMSFSHTFKYAINDLTRQSHGFKVDISTFQSDSSSSAKFVQSFNFAYLLQQNQIPSLICNEKAPSNPPSLGELKYSCTIISKTASITLTTTNNQYCLTTSTATGTKIKEIYQTKNHEITVKLNTIVCDKIGQVPIQFVDSGVPYSYTVTHQTKCPEPIIYCNKHNDIERKITCKTKVTFPFVSIDISTTSNSVQITKESIVPTKPLNTIDDDIEITYDVQKYKTKSHKFTVKLVVKQGGNNVVAMKDFEFIYALKSTEKPAISCKFLSKENDQNFDKITYQCDILSFSQRVKIKIEPTTTFTITPSKSDGASSKDVFIHDNVNLIVESVKVKCGEVQNIQIVVEDDDIQYSDFVSRKTECPVPTITYVGNNGDHDTTNRILKYKITSFYEFGSINVKSDRPNVEIKLIKGDIPVGTFTKSVDLEISYEPLDYSYDEHKISVINTIEQHQGFEISFDSKLYTFSLKPEEKPFIKCQPFTSSSSTPLHFTEKSYGCEILSKQSIISLSLSNPKYFIVKSTGKHEIHRNVYKWRNYVISIQDLEIKCNVETQIKVQFSEYGSNYEDKISIRTSCPDSQITLTSHDDKNRIINFDVTSQFPHTIVESKLSANLRMLEKEDSTIQSSNKIWKSNHVIKYDLIDLLAETQSFSVEIIVLQNQIEISKKSLQLDYTVRENEKPQIKCTKKEDKSIQKFTNSAYLCYIVAKSDSIQLKDVPDSYKLKYVIGSATPFYNLYKWNNVLVVVTDVEIHCDQPQKLTMTAFNEQESYHQEIQHISKCAKISGNCTMYENTYIYARCTYDSEMKFEFQSHSCSEMINCTRSTQMESKEKDNVEYVFEISPLTSDRYFEFYLNVTLKYSEHSNFTSSFLLEYNKIEERRVESGDESNARAASTGISFGLSGVVFVCTIAILFAFKLMKK